MTTEILSNVDEYRMLSIFGITIVLDYENTYIMKYVHYEKLLNYFFEFQRTQVKKSANWEMCPVSFCVPLYQAFFIGNAIILTIIQ